MKSIQSGVSLRQTAEQTADAASHTPFVPAADLRRVNLVASR